MRYLLIPLEFDAYELGDRAAREPFDLVDEIGRRLRP